MYNIILPQHNLLEGIPDSRYWNLRTSFHPLALVMLLSPLYAMLDHYILEE